MMSLKGVPKSQEHREKIRAVRIGTKASPETRAKMSAAALGKSKSAETRAMMSAASLGKPKSDEARAKMSAAKKGKPAARPFTAEDYAKSLATRRGKQLTPEHREKLRASHVGKPGPWAGKTRGPLTEEWRRKIGLASTGRRHSETVKDKIRQATIGHEAYHSKSRVFKYAGFRFRSSYEIRVAKALDALGISWRYEPTRFHFGKFTYTPDFYLPDDGAYWEVKGWYGPDSVRNVEAFRAAYPEIPIVVFTESCVMALEQAAKVAA